MFVNAAMLEQTVQKHAMALGYFFLAAFCAFASQLSTISLLHSMFLMASVVACGVGLVFFGMATLPQLRTTTAFLTDLFRQARQPPVTIQEQSSSASV
jgi:hypothetical protein